MKPPVRNHAQPRWGPQVNVITGGSSGVGQLNIKNPGPDAAVARASKSLDTFDILIKVTNPSNKCDSKTCMLSLQLEKIATLKCVRKHILDRISSRKTFLGEKWAWKFHALCPPSSPWMSLRYYRTLLKEGPWAVHLTLGQD